MNLESIAAERVESVLLDNGAYSVTLSDAGDNPVLEPAPGETPLWRDTKVTALFDADADFVALATDLKAKLNLDELPPNHVETLEDRVWEREWLKDFGPMQFGRRLWVVPGAQECPAGDAVVVRLDPGLAFGTGTHPTTALCLEWLESIDVSDKTVLDFGCGSGILSIAACKLGATYVTGIDIDLQAVTASRQNASRNHVGSRFSAESAVTDESQAYDIVIANILAGTLIDNAAFLSRSVRSGGSIVLSGILSTQVEAVEDAFQPCFEFDSPAVQDNWARLSGKRR